MTWTLPIGAQPDQAGTRFRVWAPAAQRVEVVLYEGDSAAETYDLAPEGDGYFSDHIAGVRPGARYMYRLDSGDPRPDPASRFQPDGVHGPSAVVDPAGFSWTDGSWRGVSLQDLVIYELHVGTATPEGSFAALIGQLDAIRDLGVTAVELMPTADFPGERNWGYDGVCLFAPARAYGGPEGLRQLADAAHARGLAVILDVVYNHLGPDGNYLRQFSEAYFTSRHVTPWGEALNFDGPGSRPVRDFFIANACYWAHEYHIDGLRLDATHAILDDSPTHILAEIAARVRESLPPDRHFTLIAENENNDPTLIRPRQEQRTKDKEQNGLHRHAQPEADHDQEQRTKDKEQNDQSLFSVPCSLFSGGYGLDAVWADDFHHQVRVALAGDREGYYMDYSGSMADLATTLRQGWFYTGQRSAYLGQRRGAPADDVAPPRFIHCIQNHDQVGNRALGERLNHEIDLAAYRAASALLLLSPYTPLVWMGQEWAASTPFLFFTDHNPELGRLVTEGRRAEFAHFAAFSGEQVPDPQALDTFLRSKLRWEERRLPPHAGILQLYHDLLDLRRRQPALRERRRESFMVAAIAEQALALRRNGPDGDDILLLVNLRGGLRLRLAEQAETRVPSGRRWTLLLDSEAPHYGGDGATRLVSEDLAAPVLELDGPGAVLFSAVSA